ncbi:MAG TPA: carotenoid biosynthesis protein [Egibacteraceae bacterium]|nr:carotenoid biosynthesis protein [Egibacteraceae bacterium]
MTGPPATAPADVRRRREVPGRAVRTAPAVLAVAVIGLQIAYPLVHGAARGRLTVATVLVFFAASVSHALVWRGRRFAATLVVVTAGGGLAVEVAGVATGWPFGAYAYAGTLGADLAGVPLVIPLAWTMMAYPALLVGRAITRHRVAGPLVAGWALASWDLFLDPQMVDAGHWAWRSGGPSVLGVPVSNFAGWTLVAVVMMALVWRAAGGGAREAATVGGSGVHAPDDRPMHALYLWVYASSVLAHATFFGLPGSAALGGVGMGTVVAAFLWSLRGR